MTSLITASGMTPLYEKVPRWCLAGNDDGRNTCNNSARRSVPRKLCRAPRYASPPYARHAQTCIVTPLGRCREETHRHSIVIIYHYRTGEGRKWKEAFDKSTPRSTNVLPLIYAPWRCSQRLTRKERSIVCALCRVGDRSSERTNQRGIYSMEEKNCQPPHRCDIGYMTPSGSVISGAIRSSRAKRRTRRPGGPVDVRDALSGQDFRKTWKYNSLILPLNYYR